jgi:hypothetical protein
MAILLFFQVAAGAAVLATPTPLLVPAAQERAIDGIWRGEMGGRSIMACFDGSIGSFYQLDETKIVTLWGESVLRLRRGTTGTELTHDGTCAPPARIGWMASGGDARSAKPVRLRRVPFVPQLGTAESIPERPCTSFVYHRDRLKPLRVEEQSARLDDVAFVRILAKPADDATDVEYQSFRLLGTEPGVVTMNKLLASFIDIRGVGESEWTRCLAGAGNVGGEFRQSLEPVRIGRRFVIANDFREGSCGGAHPYSATYPRLFDLARGTEVSIRDWLSYRALDQTLVKNLGPKTAEGEPNVLPLSNALRRDISGRAAKSDAECSGVLEEEAFWTVGVSRIGFVFSPQLGPCGQGLRAASPTAVRRDGPLS